MAIAVQPNSNVTATAQPSGFADLKSEDFFKLLISQINNQDPFEPTGNEELLKQISSIRDIELNTQLTDSLRSLTGQQNIGSASSLIGQYVTSQPGDDGLTQSGVVVGVRFDTGAQPILILSNGAEMPLANISTVVPARQAAEALVGATVRGTDRRDPKNIQEVEGVVAGVKTESNGDISLELDTGHSLRFKDMTSIVEAVS